MFPVFFLFPKITFATNIFQDYLLLLGFALTLIRVFAVNTSVDLVAYFSRAQLQELPLRFLKLSALVFRYLISIPYLPEVALSYL